MRAARTGGGSVGRTGAHGTIERTPDAGGIDDACEEEGRAGGSDEYWR
jgi:hypothetical protein